MSLPLLGSGPGSAAAVGGGGGGGPPPLDGLSPTAAWSASRQLLTAYGGAFYNLTSGRVDTLYDQSGNSRDMTQATGATRPVIDPSVVVDALNFAGSQQLAITTAVSNFISATDGYMIATVRNASFLSDSATPYVNSYVLQDNGQNFGLTVRDNSGSPLYYVGSDPNYLSASIVAGTTYVIEWRHAGGTLYQRTNGAGETSMSAGNTNVSGTIFRMGGSSFNGLIYEAATFSSVPTLSERNAMVQAFGLYAGASV